MKIQRRHFLVGAGGVIFTLPWLESLAGLSRVARADEMLEMEPQTFAIFMRSGHGFIRERLWPGGGEGKFGQLTDENMKDSALAPLIPYKDRLSVLKGVSHPYPNLDCDHKSGGIQALTGAKIMKPANTFQNGALAEGESLDFRIQRELMPGIEPLLLTSGKRNTDKVGVQDFLSFRGPRELVSAEISPFNAYKKIFGMSDMGPSEQKLLLRKSANDFLKEGLNGLLKGSKLSAEDKKRLQLHMDGIRDTEKKLQLALSEERIADLEKNSNVNSYENNTNEVIKMQIDVLTIAIAAGQFRAAVLQLGAGIDATHYFLDNKLCEYGSHAISHRVATQGEAMDGASIGVEFAEGLHHKLDTMNAGYFKYMLDKLNEYKFGSKSLVDYGGLMWFSEVGTGNHDHNNIPHMIAGGLNGHLKLGQFFDAKCHVNKVLNTIGAGVGLKNGGNPLDNFGDPDLVKKNDGNKAAGVIEGLFKA